MQGAGCGGLIRISTIARAAASRHIPPRIETSLADLRMGGFVEIDDVARRRGPAKVECCAATSWQASGVCSSCRSMSRVGVTVRC